MAKRKKKKLRKWVKVALGVLVVAAGSRIIISSANHARETASAAVPEASESTPMPVEEVSVDALGATPEPTAEASATALPYGNRGRLYIGDWSVALNGSDTGNNTDLQSYADAPDSAAYLEYNDKVMIADHASQGFSVIMSLQVGDKVTIQQEDGTEQALECTALYPDSYYKDGYVMMPDGTSAWDNTDGQYIMQTNQGSDGNSLYLAMFNEVDDTETGAEASASAEATATGETNG